MRLLGIFKLVRMRDSKLYFPRGNRSQDVVRALLQLLASGDKVAQARPSQNQGSFRRQLHRIEWRHGSTGSAEEYQPPTRAKDFKVLVEGALAHTVVDHVDAFSIGQAFCLSLEVPLAVVNNLIRS